MSNSGKQQCGAEKWLFRYLRGTVKLDLVFQSETGKSMILQGYGDATFGGDLIIEDLRQVVRVNVFTLAECVISWKFQLMKRNTRLRLASKVALWWKGLVRSFGIWQDSVRVHEDEAVIDLVDQHEVKSSRYEDEGH